MTTTISCIVYNGNFYAHAHIYIGFERALVRIKQVKRGSSDTVSNSLHLLLLDEGLRLRPGPTSRAFTCVGLRTSMENKNANCKQSAGEFPSFWRVYKHSHGFHARGKTAKLSSSFC